MSNAISSQVRFGFSDADVGQRVCSYLNSKHFPRFRDLTVEVARGVVTLTGRLDSFHERQVALNSCRRVAGVLELVDAITVADPVPGNARRQVSAPR